MSTWAGTGLTCRLGFRDVRTDESWSFTRTLQPEQLSELVPLGNVDSYFSGPSVVVRRKDTELSTGENRDLYVD